jgi:hypothetical protein
MSKHHPNSGQKAKVCMKMIPVAPLPLIAAFAEHYASRGFSVIPLTNGKRPACSWKRWQSERANEAQRHRWFVEEKGISGPVVGVGIVLGTVSGGATVRDFDEPKGYETWKRDFPELAASLPTVKTPRGYHVYSRSPVARTRFQDDGEVRGDGAYVCAPPSLHPSGERYIWVNEIPDGGLPRIEDPESVGLVSVETERPHTHTRSLCPSVIPESPVSHVPLEPHASLGMQGDNDLADAIGQNNGSSGAPVMHSPLVMQDRIEKAINTTLPTGKGQRHKLIFSLARKFRAISPDSAAADFKANVRRWHTLALPVIGTVEWAETWGDFVSGFERVKKPDENGLLAAFLATADNENAPEIAREYVDTPNMVRLIKLCRIMQRQAGTGISFYLSQKAVAEAFGVDQASLSRYLSALLADGILVRTYKGHTGKASEYLYAGDMGGAA